MTALRHYSFISHLPRHWLHTLLTPLPDDYFQLITLTIDSMAAIASLIIISTFLSLFFFFLSYFIFISHRDIYFIILHIDVYYYADWHWCHIPWYFDYYIATFRLLTESWLLQPLMIAPAETDYFCIEIHSQPLFITPFITISSWHYRHIASYIRPNEA